MKLPVETIEEFAELLVRSGLLESDQVKKIIHSYNEDFAKVAKTGSTITSFTTYLIKRDVLTCWQCNKLRQGQFRGFILGSFQLLDYQSHDEDTGVYLAQDIKSGQVVRLAIKDVVAKGTDNAQKQLGRPSYKVLGPIDFLGER